MFIVLGGTSYAVATNSIGSAQIKNNAIRSRDIRNNQVASADIKNGSLTAVDFRIGGNLRVPVGRTTQVWKAGRAYARPGSKPKCVARPMRGLLQPSGRGCVFQAAGARSGVGATASISGVPELLGVVTLVLAILVVIALTFTVVLIPLSRRAKRAQAGLEEELGGSIERSANVSGLGLQSLGRGQVRGNGRLVLTPDELRFRQWVPQRETTIPLAAVTSIGTERTWLGKWVGSKLLCVRWRTPEGSEDAMAWQVPGLEGWLAALRRNRDRSSA